MLLAGALAMGRPTPSTVVETCGVHAIEAPLSGIEVDVDSGGVELAPGDAVVVRDTTRDAEIGSGAIGWPGLEGDLDAHTASAGVYRLDLQTGSGQVSTDDVLDERDALASIESRTARGDTSVVGR